MSRRWLILACLTLTGCAGGSGNHPAVEMVTNMGTVRMELFEDEAPRSVKNFLQYVDEKHYDGTIFHRVIPTFMIQGGGFQPGLRPVESKHQPIRNESTNGLLNKRGTVAMARTPDPHSATDQFFINVQDNAFLDQDKAQDGWGYAVFGRVIQGMDVVDAIRKVRTTTVDGQSDVPVNDVIIESIRRVQK